MLIRHSWPQRKEARFREFINSRFSSTACQRTPDRALGLWKAARLAVGWQAPWKSGGLSDVGVFFSQGSRLPCGNPHYLEIILTAGQSKRRTKVTLIHQSTDQTLTAQFVRDTKQETNMCTNVHSYGRSFSLRSLL